MVSLARVVSAPTHRAGVKVASGASRLERAPSAGALRSAMAASTILLDKPFPPQHQAWLEDRFDVCLLQDCQKPKECVGLLWFGHAPVSGELLDKFPNLRVCSNFGVGYDHFDCGTICTTRGIPAGHTPGVLSETVADFTMALLLASARDVVTGAVAAQRPDFVTLDKNKLGKQVSGAVVGVVGLGSIGRAFARRAAAFRCILKYHNRRRLSPEEEQAAGGATFCATLEELLLCSDFVVLLCPVTPETRGLMCAKTFAMMKPGAVLVNMGRGKLVDQDALVEALRSGQVGRAALDVTEPEPLPRDHPLVRVEGTELEGRVLITPHLGSATNETRFAMLQMAVANLEAGIAGVRLPNPVPEYREANKKRPTR